MRRNHQTLTPGDLNRLSDEIEELEKEGHLDTITTQKAHALLFKGLDEETSSDGTVTYFFFTLSEELEFFDILEAARKKRRRA
jgi:hypothetical protein